MRACACPRAGVNFGKTPGTYTSNNALFATLPVNIDSVIGTAIAPPTPAPSPASTPASTPSAQPPVEQLPVIDTHDPWLFLLFILLIIVPCILGMYFVCCRRITAEERAAPVGGGITMANLKTKGVGAKAVATAV